MRPGNSLLPYFGGKAGEIGRMTALLLEKIPHTTYCELYGGMASVLLYKDLVKQEVYNDVNSDIVNLFSVLRFKKHRKELRELLRNTPYSRAHWKECCVTYKDTTLDPVERARQLFVVLGQGMLGRLQRKSWAFGGPLYGTSPAKSFYRKLERLDLVAERFRNVSLECQPALKLLARWDASTVLVYLDPPYYPSTRAKDAAYLQETDHEAHVAIVTAALAVKRAKVVIAGYPNQLYTDTLEAAGWVRQDFEVHAESAKKSGTKSLRVESLWFSPNCNFNVQPKEKLTKMLVVKQMALEL